MKKRFHVQILFCPMFQIKRKKMGKYLFTILKYVYLCVKFNSVTQEVTDIHGVKKYDFNETKINKCWA